MNTPDRDTCSRLGGICLCAEQSELQAENLAAADVDWDAREMSD